MTGKFGSDLKNFEGGVLKIKPFGPAGGRFYSEFLFKGEVLFSVEKREKTQQLGVFDQSHLAPQGISCSAFTGNFPYFLVNIFQIFTNARGWEKREKSAKNPL